ncbi:MAG: hypothetical protein ACI4UV_18855 [Victivallales bacterium]
MVKIQSTRSIDSESYDIWDAGSRSDIIHVQQVVNKLGHLPLVPTRLMDVSRCDRRWFQHVNYGYMALEMILQGSVEYRTERQTRIATQGMLYVVAHGSNVRMVTAGNGYRRKLSLLICGSCLDSIAEVLGLGHDRLLKLSDPGAVERMMREIGKGIEEKKARNICLPEPMRCCWHWRRNGRANPKNSVPLWRRSPHPRQKSFPFRNSQDFAESASLH